MRFPKPASKGFTLIELLVVIGIFGLLTALIFARQSQFTGGSLLTNVAYQIALTIRQAQVYGLSVREFSSGGFNYPYGVHFDKSEGMKSSIVFFVDSGATPPVSSGYNPQMPSSANLGTCGNDGNPCLDLLSISRGNYVEDVCAVPSSGSSCTSVDKLDISFVRPDPEARIVSITGGAATGGNIRGCVTLASPQGTTKRYVIVTNTGQISVSTDSCL